MKQFTINSVEVNEATYVVSLTAEIFEDADISVDEDGNVILPEPSTSATTTTEIAPLDMANEQECLSILSYVAIAALGFDGAFSTDNLPYADCAEALFEEGTIITLL